MNELKRKKLRAIISELEKIRGRHTELVSAYVPAEFNLAKVMSQIKTEQSTAQNIKSKTVRKNVMAALEKIIQHLKLYRQTPANGLVVFCGNISDNEGVADIELWAIEPPEPMRQRLYRCDQVFILEPLKEMIKEREIYGLIVLDKSEADVGLLVGKKIKMLKHMESVVPGKTKAGGWSQARFARVREGLLHDFLKNVGDIASDQLKAHPNLLGIIVGGPGPVKEHFVNEDFLNYELKKKIIGTVDTAYTGEYGLREIVHRADDIIAEASVVKERRILERFFNELARDSGIVTYGFSEVLKVLESGNVELLLLSDGFDWVSVELCCNCGFRVEKNISREQIEDQRCPSCDAKLSVESEKDITEKLIEKAESMGTQVEIISTETELGRQLKELGGIGAILRYRV